MKTPAEEIYRQSTQRT